MISSQNKNFFCFTGPKILNNSGPKIVTVFGFSTSILTDVAFFNASAYFYLCARSKFGGCQGRWTGVAVTAVSTSLILEGRVTKD